MDTPKSSSYIDPICSTEVEKLRRELLLLISNNDIRYAERAKMSEEGVKSALASASLAVDKAETNAEKWRVNANEWRGAMNDRESEFVRKGEFRILVGMLTIVLVVFEILKYIHG